MVSGKACPIMPPPADMPAPRNPNATRPKANTAGAIMMVEGSILTLLLFGWLFARTAREGEERQELLELAYGSPAGYLGAVIAKEMGRADSKVPDYVTFYTQTEGRSFAPGEAGFLGARFAPMRWICDG